MKFFCVLLCFISLPIKTKLEPKMLLQRFRKVIKSIEKFKGIKIYFLKECLEIRENSPENKLTFNYLKFHNSQMNTISESNKCINQIKLFLDYIEKHKITNSLFDFMINSNKNDLKGLRAKINELCIFIQDIQFKLVLASRFCIKTKESKEFINKAHKNLDKKFYGIMHSICCIKANYEIFLTLLPKEYTTHYKQSEIEAKKRNLINNKIKNMVAKKVEVLENLNILMNTRTRKNVGLNILESKNILLREIIIKLKQIKRIGGCTNTSQNYVSIREKILGEIFQKRGEKIKFGQKFFIDLIKKNQNELQTDLFISIKFCYKIKKLETEAIKIKTLVEEIEKQGKLVLLKKTKKDLLYLYVRIEVVSLEYLSSIIELYFVVVIKIDSYLKRCKYILKDSYMLDNNEEVKGLVTKFETDIESVRCLIFKLFTKIINPKDNVTLEKFCLEENNMLKMMYSIKESLIEAYTKLKTSFLKM
ncbi:hypothetical protein TUBRATIS_24830 [Tubulinosema ratisbonensis]|uniref:Uncharacterized protein n=1 Tax=Tubulinosema ratisbonensis TaxID=291195 RepID=A0A437AJ41_9MICR|nr:hypothetical protein TUBRATIS_24830 [Tubulinosema ratisbonensis]